MGANRIGTVFSFTDSAVRFGSQALSEQECRDILTYLDRTSKAFQADGDTDSALQCVTLGVELITARMQFSQARRRLEQSN